MKPGDERASALRLPAWELEAGVHEVLVRSSWIAVVDQKVARRTGGVTSKLYLFLAGDRVMLTSPSTLWWARRMVAA